MTSKRLRRRVRHAGAFSFASPIKASGSAQAVNVGEEERLLQQLSDQVDAVRRTLDALLIRKASLHDDPARGKSGGFCFRCSAPDPRHDAGRREPARSTRRGPCWRQRTGSSMPAPTRSSELLCPERPGP